LDTGKESTHILGAEQGIPFVSFMKSLKYDHDMKVSERQEDGVKICIHNGKWHKAKQLTLEWP
jgi:hypothetical protein